jgi:hypothetical protein
MGEREEIERLYQQLGGSFKALYPWQIYVLTSSDRFDRLYGQRADKVKKLYNGMLPCYLYEYFKPAEARSEDLRTAKEIYEKKPVNREGGSGFDRGRDQGAFARKDGFRKDFPRKDGSHHDGSPRKEFSKDGNFKKSENRPYPPKKK